MVPGPFWPSVHPNPVLPVHFARVKIFGPRTLPERLTATLLRTDGSALTKMSYPLIESEFWTFTATSSRVPFRAETAKGVSGQDAEAGSAMHTVPVNWPWTWGSIPKPPRNERISMRMLEGTRLRLNL